MTTEAPPKPALTNVRCGGTLHNGKPCNALLFKAAGVITVTIKIKCDKCHDEQTFGPVE